MQVVIYLFLSSSVLGVMGEFYSPTPNASGVVAAERAQYLQGHKGLMCYKVLLVKLYLMPENHQFTNLIKTSFVERLVEVDTVLVSFQNKLLHLKIV